MVELPKFKDIEKIRNFRSPKRIFLIRIGDENSKLNRLHLPFCMKCALDDWEDMIQKILSDGKRKYGKLVDETIDENIEDNDVLLKLAEEWDLEKYKKGFKLIGERDAMDRIPGEKILTLVGKYLDFVCECNERHRQSVYVPLVVYHEWKVKGILNKIGNISAEEIQKIAKNEDEIIMEKIAKKQLEKEKYQTEEVLGTQK